MNFLAHALLAGEGKADRIGGLIGDFIKGPLPAALSAPLASGVALHRAIDSFAEQHAAFRRSRQRVSPERRRVAGILVDLFYDHLLARDWARYVTAPLEDFETRLFADLNDYAAELPTSARETAQRMQHGHWLLSYRHPLAVGQAIDRMSTHRMRRANPLAGGIEELLADIHGFAEDFNDFLPAAQAFARHWRAQRNA